MVEANRDIQLERGPVIPAAELAWSFGPSGGPGGQHANRSNTRVELRFDVGASSAFDDLQRSQLLTGLERRLVNGVLVVVSDEHRSQFRNRQDATRRLAGILDDALAPPPPPRRPTKPSRSARRRRLDEKRRRSETKQLRRRIR